MKVVILAGGLGTRLSEETTQRPKPLVEIGGRPILWHIMKIYSTHGFNDFIVCAGYKGYMIKEYFANYALHNSNIHVNLQNGEVRLENSMAEPWNISIIDTGDSTLTGGRVKRISAYLGSDEEFMMTYGDGVADVNVKDLLAHHRAEGRMATVTGAQPPGRFGQLSVSGNMVNAFQEKPIGEAGWINAGFFVLSRQVLDFIEGDETTFEREPLERLSHEKQLTLYRHTGFWLPMDTVRDKIVLEEMWRSNQAPWKIW